MRELRWVTARSECLARAAAGSGEGMAARRASHPLRASLVWCTGGAGCWRGEEREPRRGESIQAGRSSHGNLGTAPCKITRAAGLCCHALTSSSIRSDLPSRAERARTRPSRSSARRLDSASAHSFPTARLLKSGPPSCVSAPYPSAGRASGAARRRRRRARLVDQGDDGRRCTSLSQELRGPEDCTWSWTRSLAAKHDPTPASQR